MSSTFRFYRCDAPPERDTEPLLACEYSARLWTPEQGGVAPLGLPLAPFGIWTAMHHLRLFANSDYGVLVVYRDGRLVHRSGLFPRYARFPFMRREDLQVGDVWTDPEHRNRGLASFALRRLVDQKVRNGRRIWYVVEAENAASIRTVERCGFVLVGTGTRTKRLGLALLGHFVMESSRGLV